MKRELHYLCYAILILSIWTDVMGCVDFGATVPHTFTSVFGDSVELFGRGLYRNDAKFTATIFRGTDLASLIFFVPAFILTLRYDRRKKSEYSGLLLISMLGIALYTSANKVLGTFDNPLHLVYIVQASCSLYGFIWAMSVHHQKYASSFEPVEPTKVLSVFLILGAVFLSVAWLPDFINFYRTGIPPLLLHYHVQPTYFLDMGVVAPMLMICYFLLKQKTLLGKQLLAISLVFSMFIGVTLPVQSIVQFAYGIELTIRDLVLRVFTFVLMALFAFILFRRSITSNSVR